MKVSSPLVLIYHMPQEQMQKLRQVCSGLNIAVKAMGPDTVSVPLGMAAGAEDWRNPLLSQTHNVKDPGPLTEPLLVIAGLEEALFDRFLAVLRREQMIIPMKAVLTANNANWNALQLAAHIAEERKAFLRAHGG